MWNAPLAIEYKRYIQKGLHMYGVQSTSALLGSCRICPLYSNSWHVVLLTDTVFITKLVKTEDASAFGIRGECAMNRHESHFSKGRRKQFSKVFFMTNAEWSIPPKKMISHGNLRVKRVVDNCTASLGCPCCDGTCLSITSIGGPDGGGRDGNGHISGGGNNWRGSEIGRVEGVSSWKEEDLSILCEGMPEWMGLCTSWWERQNEAVLLFNTDEDGAE